MGEGRLKTFAKILIMLVRLIALVSIVFGVMIWAASGMQFLGVHIGLGFAITLLVVLLAVMGLMRGAIGLGIGALVVAGLLPYVGFKQFPLVFKSFGAMQVAHVVVVLAALGMAEALHARIAKS